MRPTVTLRKALADPALLGTILSGDSWRAWRVLLIAAMGEPLTDDERVIFKKLTGREREPGQRVEELLGVVGRRGGKSRAIATLAAYIGGLCDHRDVIVRGESAVLLCIAPDQRQANIALSYATAAFEASPIMRQLVVSKTADTLTLATGVTIEVRSASFRRLRGPSYCGIIADEAAYLFASDEGSANADTEILNAVRPGLATTRGPLISISSPYARRGEVWTTYKRHFGPEGDPLILVAQGTSRDFNPSLPQSVIDRAMERDPAAASAEYLAQFRTDIESLLTREAVEACVALGIRERAPETGVTYFGFVDPSGGSSDSMSAACGHREDGVAVIDVIRERRPPFSPQDVVAEFSALFKDYRVDKIIGDRYAGLWPVESFAQHDIRYEQSAKPKTDLYQALVPVVNSQQVSLLESERLTSQLINLERRTARGGRDSIDHPPGAHDDVANAVAGVVSLINVRSRYDSSLSWVDDFTNEERNAQFRREMLQRLGYA
ncbi:MAG: hypothetical protein WDO17_15655 [Alphaproteobacteria bacterium]